MVSFPVTVWCSNEWNHPKSKIRGRSEKWIQSSLSVSLFFFLSPSQIYLMIVRTWALIPGLGTTGWTQCFSNILYREPPQEMLGSPLYWKYTVGQPHPTVHMGGKISECSWILNGIETSGLRWGIPELHFSSWCFLLRATIKVFLNYSFSYTYSKCYRQHLVILVTPKIVFSRNVK